MEHLPQQENNYEKLAYWELLTKLFREQGEKVEILRSEHKDVPDVFVLATHTDMPTYYSLILFKQKQGNDDIITLIYSVKSTDDDYDPSEDRRFIAIQDTALDVSLYDADEPDIPLQPEEIKDMMADIEEASYAWRQSDSRSEASAYTVPSTYIPRDWEISLGN